MQQYITMGSALSNLFSTYGIDILKDGNRLCAIFGDIAPSLEKERKIIRRAMDEGVLELIFDAQSADSAKRSSIISKIEYTLKSEAGFSDEWYQILMTGFSEAFAWTLPAPKTTTVAPVTTIPTTPATKKKYFTKNIARNTFSTSPKQIVLPEKYNAVGEHAFDYIGLPVHVDSVTIPNGYIEIQRYAFYPLKIDNFINIPDSVTEIAESAFALEKYAYVVCSPNSYAYSYCKSHYLANSVDGIPKRPEHIRLDKEDSVVIKAGSTVDEWLNTKYQELIIPTGTTSIEKGAFRNRNDIEIVLADDSLEFIKKGAFANCNSLQCVYLGFGVRSIASDSFSNCSNLKLVYINLRGDEFEQIDRILGKEPQDLWISESAFSGCSQLKYIVSLSYSKKLDSICKALHLTYVYDDITLNKKSASSIPDELKLLTHHVIRRVAQLHI